MTRFSFVPFALSLPLAACSVDAPEQEDPITEADRESSKRAGLDLRTFGPLAAYSLYVDPDSNAAYQADAWASTDPDAADLMASMAEKPLGLWIGDWTSDVASTVEDAVTAGGTELRTLVLYNIPNRDCGAWSSGGAADASAYETFIDAVAAGLDGRTAIIVLEPDALALTTCLDAAGVLERESLLSDAVDTITAAGGLVYLDAGDSNWIGASTMAAQLTAAGVARAAGFALNVSHTETTINEIGFANELRAILGTSAHYVIDTGRNGLGPTTDNEWCNPLERALGRAPTTRTLRKGLDAVLWVKPPGESDGSCNGGPVAGDWWPEYALGLAELAPV